MTWTYSQSTGQLSDADGNLVATGYSGGNCGKNPDGVNNPALQDQACIGPLPQGFYGLGVPQDNPRLGPYAIPLTPDATNEMYGRSGFFVHGDTSAMDRSASEGCIIMPRTVREQMYNSQDHTLQVVV
jgi:hypothetical protein